MFRTEKQYMKVVPEYKGDFNNFKEVIEFA